MYNVIIKKSLYIVIYLFEYCVPLLFQLMECTLPPLCLLQFFSSGQISQELMTLLGLSLLAPAVQY